MCRHRAAGLRTSRGYDARVPHAAYVETVPYPAEVVFGFVADAENNPRWHEHVHETRWIDPPPTGSAVVPDRPVTCSGATGRSSPRSPSSIRRGAVTFQVIEGYRVRTAIEVAPSTATSPWSS